MSAVRQDKVKDACSGVHLNVHSPPVAVVWQFELRLLQHQRVAVSEGVNASLHLVTLLQQFQQGWHWYADLDRRTRTSNGSSMTSSCVHSCGD